MAGLAGFLPYLYIPIAASTHPVVNWDTATTFKNFLHLLLRKDYGYGKSGLPFNGTPILLSNYFRALATTYSYQIIAVMILGAVQLFKKDKRLLLALMAAYLIAGPFLIAYISAPATSNSAWGLIERFYVMSSVLLAFFIPFGLIFIKTLLEKVVKKKLYVTVFMLYFLIIPLLLFFYTYPKTDLSKTQIGNTLALNILNPLPKNAVLHLYGDTTTFNVWYASYVLKIRPDIDLIHPPGPGGNTYFDNELNAYYKKHPEAKLTQLPGLTLQDIRTRRLIFSTYELGFVPEDSSLVPKGLVYQLMEKKDLPDQAAYLKEVQSIWKTFTIPTVDGLLPSEQNLVAQEIPTLYSNSFIRTANFLILQYNDIGDAIPLYAKAAAIDPHNSGAWVSLGISQVQAEKNCTDGLKNIEKGIALYPLTRKYWLQLYAGYTWCDKKQEMIQVEKYYHDKFKRDMKEDVKKLNI